MSWRDELLSASYNGVPFKVEKVHTTAGRKLAIHYYPRPKNLTGDYDNSIYPYVEDLGRGPKTFTITGFVIQESSTDWNYFTARDALLDALSEPGPGTLIHPSYGEKYVHLSKEVSVVEEFTTAGGQASFEMEFIEVARGTSIEVETRNPITEYANVYQDLYANSYEDTFQSSYDVTTHPDAVKSTSLSDLLKLYRFVWRIIQTTPRNFVQQMISIFVFDILTRMKGAHTTVLLATSIIAAIESIFSSIPNLTPIESKPIPPNVTSLILLSYFGDDETTSPGYTYGSKLDILPSDSSAITTQANTNRTAFVEFVKSMALLYAGQAMLEADYSSYEDMVEIRDWYSDRVENVIENSTNDELCSSLEAMHSLVITGLVQLGASLKHYVDYAVPPGIDTTLTLAYNTYEDIDREEEIIDSNISIKHPGFMPGGTAIKILES